MNVYVFRSRVFPKRYLSKTKRYKALRGSLRLFTRKLMLEFIENLDDIREVCGGEAGKVRNFVTHSEGLANDPSLGDEQALRGFFNELEILQIAEKGVRVLEEGEVDEEVFPVGIIESVRGSRFNSELSPEVAWRHISKMRGNIGDYKFKKLWNGGVDPESPSVVLADKYLDTIEPLYEEISEIWCGKSKPDYNVITKSGYLSLFGKVSEIYRTAVKVYRDWFTEEFGADPIGVGYL